MHTGICASWYPTCVQSFSPIPFTVFGVTGIETEEQQQQTTYTSHAKFRQTILGFSLKVKVFVWDMPSTTVLGDTHVNPSITEWALIREIL